MGYGKSPKKGNQALMKEQEELAGRRLVTIILIVVGVVLVIGGLAGQTFASGGLVSAEVATGLVAASFAAIAAGAIAVAVGVIWFSQVNLAYIQVKEQVDKKNSKKKK